MIKIFGVLLSLLLVATFAREIKPLSVEIPKEWILSAKETDPNAIVRIYIALKYRNMEKLQRIALQVSDPSDSEYGNHLTFEEVSNLIAPEPAATKLVTAWLELNGISNYQITDNKGWIIFDYPVSVVEKLLGCEFQTFEHTRVSSIAIRSLESYVIPPHLDHVIEVIAGVHGLPKITKDQITASSMPKIVGQLSPAVNVTPAMIYQRNNVTVLKTDPTLNSTVAVAEFQVSYGVQDLQTFFQSYAPNLAGETVKAIIGPNPTNESNPEGDLDIQYIMAMGPNAPAYFYNINSNPFNNSNIFDSYLEWTLLLVNDPKPPLVNSYSWGAYGGIYPKELLYRIDGEFSSLASRGVSVIVASGDVGVGCNNNGTYFADAYPSSQWITLLGSTNFQVDGNNVPRDEYGSSFSSGGFSSYHPLADWQATAVNSYLSTAANLPPFTFFNRSGRAFPDVAAVGENVIIVSSGFVQPVDGTSCSAPIFAGMISSMNEARIKAGKSPLGYLNQLLYKMAVDAPSTFYDVTQGNNAYPPCPGFPAAPGWDAVTGLGTPNFKAIFQYVTQIK